MAGSVVINRRDRFRKILEKRFSLRFHMFMILTATFCSGILASKLMLAMHVHSMTVRYPLAVVCSYLTFFGFMKLWLIYLSSSAGSRVLASSFLEKKNSPETGIGGLDLSLDLPSGGGSGFSSGGGSFAGGGASASFDSTPGAVPQMSLQSIAAAPSDSGGGALKGIADSVGDGASGIFDDDGIVLLVLGVLLALFMGAGVYLIYQAPAILSDAAFQAILSTGLIRSMKKMSAPDWMGSVLRTTALPFLAVLLISILAARVVHSAYPEAVKMSEVLHQLL